MHVNVEKTSERPTIIAVRDDGVSLRVIGPDRKFSPPHDLIHFIVEKGMHLQRGFWGSIAAGAKFSSMEVIDGRQKPRANERSIQIIKANEHFLSEAEAIVGAFQTTLHDVAPDEEALWRLLRTRGRKFEGALIHPTWAQLVSFREQWEELSVGRAIRLEWS
ncbi:hypothetical protein GWG65_25335 [Bradyrhizobium sp. CSA207]|uniref:hypothetical protein n=1 Tax=Bradyrhizobium sp. CSA207 TaxID=2698826 RepID=UPI0023B1BA74|nr:hypothetical protein [Bradyrhizobium sp. CSA207]MDE5444710.1 hypothetical protein [Bradyrhizobium sp. CSA207]